MTRQVISTGSSANDGTGDTLRSGATKINANFSELYTFLGGNANTLASQVVFEDSAVVFEGSLADSFETRLTAINPTADRQIKLPDAAGITVLDTATQTLTNKTLTTPVIASLQQASGSNTLTMPAATDTLVGKATTDTLTNKTLTAPTVTGLPKISKGFALADSAGDEVVVFDLTTAGTAVNEVKIANNVTNNPPIISATGGDTNVSLNLTGKGTGAVLLERTAYNASTITANGAASAAHAFIICNKGSALAVTLADGSVVGEFKIFTNKGAGVATVTPANFAAGTSFALAQNEGAQCVWDGANWFLVGNQSVTTVA
jgi:hypothetical protein